MDFVYGKCKFNYLPKKVEPESRGFEKVILHKYSDYLACMVVNPPPSMTGFQRFLTSNYRVNEYIEYTGGIFTWKNQQL